MTNIISAIADEHIEEKEEWRITDALAADWALDKIREAKAEYAQKEMIVREKIRQLEEWLEKEQEKRDRTVNFFTSKLLDFFETAPKRKTKTQEIFELPSGKLRKKYQGPKFERDDEALLKWIKKNDINAHLYIKVKETPDWAKFKTTIKVAGEYAVDANGEIIDGIRVVERPPVFEAEV